PTATRFQFTGVLQGAAPGITSPPSEGPAWTRRTSPPTRCTRSPSRSRGRGHRTPPRPGRPRLAPPECATPLGQTVELAMDHLLHLLLRREGTESSRPPGSSVARPARESVRAVPSELVGLSLRDPALLDEELCELLRDLPGAVLDIGLDGLRERGG